MLYDEGRRCFWNGREIDGDEFVRRLAKAAVLAPTLELCRALCRGEQVPRAVLELSRFEDDFVSLDDFGSIPKPLKEKGAA